MVDEGDLGAEAAEHLTELAADIASPEHEQATLSPATAEPLELIRAAHSSLAGMREGLQYNRAAVLLGDLSEGGSTPSLGAAAVDPALATAMDAIASRYGTASIGHGGAGLRASPTLAMRREHLSAPSTTQWEQLLRAST